MFLSNTFVISVSETFLRSPLVFQKLATRRKKILKKNSS